MAKSQQSRFVRFTEWVGLWFYPISFGFLSLALLGVLAPLRVEPMLVSIGLVVFTVAILIQGRVFVTCQMKTVEELGFTRNRDYFVYVGSAAGIDLKIGVVGICAFGLAIGLGSGAIGRASGGAALLAFSVFALSGAVARLRRTWPVDRHPEESGQRL